MASLFDRTKSSLLPKYIIINVIKSYQNVSYLSTTKSILFLFNLQQQLCDNNKIYKTFWFKLY